jgi:S-adenosylmethionine:diacylglycerol 3-amino-3-carboxypropyl transferase
MSQLLDNKVNEINCKIFFSQTREDSQIETSQSEPNAKILLIGSGGDTVCSLVASNLGREIDVLDFNLDQLFLVRLKVALIKNFDGDFVRKFLSGEQNSDTIFNVLGTLGVLDSNLKDYWSQSENFEMITQGLNQIGRFEQLFKLAAIEGSFEKYFSNNNLIKVFGESAVKYSMNRTFVEHFKKVLQTYKQTYKSPQENYFYNQFVNNCYEGDLPIYLTKTEPIRSNAIINYHQMDLLTFFRTKSTTYDLIQLSNITDWLDPKIFTELLDLVFRSLEPNGKVILRRLNSDTNLKNFLREYASFSENNFEIADMTLVEKSHFYQEVIVLQKYCK